MKTKEEYFKDEAEKEHRKTEEFKEKLTREILEEIKGWDSDKLKEEYTKCRLSRISYGGSISAGWMWSWSKEECRFCGLEYIYGHEHCCDDCWDKNKGKTLEELDNE